MLTPARFKDIFPEFKTDAYTDAQVQAQIDMAAPLFDESRWDDLYEAGVACLVAHELVCAKADSVPKVFDDAVMKKVGEIQKQRDATLMQQQADNPYKRTTYGQRYLYYMRLVGGGISAV